MLSFCINRALWVLMVLLLRASCWAMSLTLAPWARRSNTENSRSDNNECSGFRLKDHELQIRTACTPEVWTDLTDAGSLKLSALSWQVHCERRGPWLARSVTVQLSAQWPRDPTKTLSLSQTIALRNEVPAQPWPAICGAPA